jgi:RimJ/RimL family protein N-acetyltransferase
MTLPRALQPPVGPAAEAAAAHRAALPALETARLVLRAPRVEDAPLWIAIWKGPDSPEPATEEHAWEEFCGYVAGWLLHGHGLWAVERKADAALIGFVLLGLEWEDLEPEIGWALAPEARGRGYATEAAAAVQAHALALIGPGAVVSYIAEGNEASARVAEKIGARRVENYDETTRVYRHGASLEGLTE